MKLATLIPYVVLLAGCVSEARQTSYSYEPVTEKEILDRIALVECEAKIAYKQIQDAEKLRELWATAASGSSASWTGSNPAVEGFRQVTNSVIDLQNHYNTQLRELARLQRKLKALH
jgi:NTP pyrophosphatase (non-canonical NTP hydrolase)